jgi:hypothetical protein
VDEVIKSLEDMVGSGFTSSTISKAKKSDYLVQQAGIIHDSIKAEITDMFANDPNYYKMAIREMLAGELKFGKGSPGVAEYILYPEPELISIDSAKIFQKHTMDIRVDFKSQSAPASGNVGNYRYWSVVQLIQKRLRMNEDISIIQDIRNYIRNLFNSIRSWLMDDWIDLLDFMEMEVI